MLQAEGPHSSSNDGIKHNTNLTRYVDKDHLHHRGSEPFMDATSRTVWGTWWDGEPGLQAS